MTGCKKGLFRGWIVRLEEPVKGSSWMNMVDQNRDTGLVLVIWRGETVPFLRREKRG